MELLKNQLLSVFFLKAEVVKNTLARFSRQKKHNLQHKSFGKQPSIRYMNHICPCKSLLNNYPSRLRRKNLQTREIVREARFFLWKIESTMTKTKMVTGEVTSYNY